MTYAQGHALIPFSKRLIAINLNSMMSEASVFAQGWSTRTTWQSILIRLASHQQFYSAALRANLEPKGYKHSAMDSSNSYLPWMC
jgi:hypothetical protein